MHLVDFGEQIGLGKPHPKVTLCLRQTSIGIGVTLRFCTLSLIIHLPVFRETLKALRSLICSSVNLSVVLAYFADLVNVVLVVLTSDVNFTWTEFISHKS